MIPADDSVRLLYDVTEGLDYTELYKTYSTIGRNPAVLPEIMFRIIVYGYMEGIYSSRDLEKACKRDINFKWLLQGQKPPEHNSISRFRSHRLADCVESLFNQLIKKLGELKEIEFDNIFIDGTKIEAYANRYSFVWKKATDKFEAKLQEKTIKVLENLEKDFQLEVKNYEDKLLVTDINNVLNKLYIIKENENITFVHGKGKRKSKFQKYVE
ncbi:transposase, partial [Clostridium botulinum]|nr:transposase [Clostridium botulinum]